MGMHRRRVGGPPYIFLSYVCKLYHVTFFDTNMDFVLEMVMLCVL